MWGTSSPDDKLTGDLGNVIESTKIGGRRLDRLVAGNLSPSNFGLLQHYRSLASDRQPRDADAMSAMPPIAAVTLASHNRIIPAPAVILAPVSALDVERPAARATLRGVFPSKVCRRLTYPLTLGVCRPCPRSTSRQLPCPNPR